MKKNITIILLVLLVLLAACSPSEKSSISGNPLNPLDNKDSLLTAPEKAIVDAYNKPDNNGDESDEGVTYYVSNTLGDDNNDGKSEDKALKSLNLIIGMTFNPGDSIRLKCDDEWTADIVLKGNGTGDNPITFSSYGKGKRPKITGTVSLANSSGWIIRGLQIFCASPDDMMAKRGTGTAISITYSGDAAKKYSDIIIEDNEIYGNGFDKNTRGIVVNASFPTGKGETLTNLKINNNIVHDIGWIGISTTGSDTVKRTNLTSTDIYRNVQINGNHVYNIGGLGTFMMCVTDGEYKRNLVHEAGQYNGEGGTGWGPVGYMTIASKNIDVMFNEVYGMKDSNTSFDGTGIDIDWTSTNVKLQYNYCHDNYGAGIVTMACRDSYVTNNRLKNNEARTTAGRGQIALTDYTDDKLPDHMTGVRNLIIDGNIIYVDLEGTSALSSMVPTEGDEWMGNQFINNRVVMRNTTKSTFINLTSNGKIDTFINNRYYSDNYFKSIIEYKMKVYMDLATWQEDGFDEGMSLKTLDNELPGKVKGIKATVDAGGIKLDWDKSNDKGSDIWHYNIHIGVDADFNPTYLNMLGETGNESFTFDSPNVKGDYYIKITSEDNNGNICNKASAVKITLK